eukprot:3188342-Rhodomonas_salina.1
MGHARWVQALLRSLRFRDARLLDYSFFSGHSSPSSPALSPTPPERRHKMPQHTKQHNTTEPCCFPRSQLSPLLSPNRAPFPSLLHHRMRCVL